MTRSRPHFHLATGLRPPTRLPVSRLRVSNRDIALLYVLLMLPLVLLLAWRTPPFQVADEDNHFLRAVQVSQGGMRAARLADGTIGGELPAGADALAHGFEDLRFLPRVHIEAGRMAAAERIDWGGPHESSFANTAIYPPLFYIPAATALLAARQLHLRVLASLRLARVTTGVTAIAIAALAIGVTASGALLLFWLLSLPMTACLFASCSQDALLIAGAALAAAAISRLAHGRRSNRTAWAAIALFVGSMAAARAPYLLLAPLPALWAWRRGGVRSAAAALLAATSLAAGLGWLMLAAGPVMAPNMAASQAHFLLDHPLRILAVAKATLQLHTARLLQEFIGVLGWLDVLLPGWFYAASLLVFCLFLAAERPGRISRLAVITAVGLLACAGAIFAALYLDWTPVGGTTVEGVQGRYFITVALFAILLLPGRRTYPPAILPILIVWASVAALVAVTAVFTHYGLGKPPG